MKAFALALLLSASMLWAQQQTPPATGQQQHGMMQHNMGNMGQQQHGAMMQHNTGDMGQHMKSMLDQMKTRLDTMKSALDKVNDPAAKDALQADYDLWNTMYTHMQQMQGMMSQHMQGQASGSGYGMMGMGYGVGSGSGTAKSGTTKSTTPKSGTTKPGSTTPPPQR